MSQYMFFSTFFIALVPAVAPCSLSSQANADSIPIPEELARAYAAGTRNPDGTPGPHYWQLSPVYELAAKLDPATATLNGSGSVFFLNPGLVPMSEVVLRLDQNRFLRGVSEDAVTSGIQITSLSINDRPISLDSDAVSGLTSTVLRIRLLEALEPQEGVRIELGWNLEIPRDEQGQALRQGHSGNSVFQIAQWYPRLAMYDDIAGWDLAPHHPALEFFNPFGTFTVSVEVPAVWLVGATGELQNPGDVLSEQVLNRLARLQQVDTTMVIVGPEERNNATAQTSGWQLWRFRAESVSDFAWGTSADYSWAATSRSRVGREPLIVHAFMASGHSPTGLTQNVVGMIGRLSETLMPYAWDKHTLVGGPEGGMEYPMLTMSSGRASSHETVHQWFPMMVGSDETRFVFLDEGLAVGLSGLATGRPLARSFSRLPIPEALIVPHDLRGIRTSAEYGYFRGSRMIYALANNYGDEAVTLAFSSYANEWKFKHPTPWDFMASIERSLQEDLAGFWKLWLFSAETVGH